jgi:hypothetical protein
LGHPYKTQNFKFKIKQKKHLTKKMHKLPLDVPKIFLLMKNTLNVLKIKKNKNIQGGPKKSL